MTDPTPLDPENDPSLAASPPPQPSTPPEARPSGTTFYGAVRSPSAWRIAAIALAGIALMISAAVVIGASPSPSSDSGAAPSASGGTKDVPGGHMGGYPGGLPGFERGPGFGGPFGGLGREITISAVDGSNVSLKTEDGWTRTIAISSSTALTKGGQTISAADLKVGDAVRFQQTRNSDGTYSITALQVVLPTVAGEVTAKSGNSITIKRADGTTQVVNVTSSTTYRVAGATNATLAQVTVGMRIVAEGTQNGDGSLTATRVAAGTYGPKGPGGHGGPAPSASPGASGTTNG